MDLEPQIKNHNTGPDALLGHQEALNTRKDNPQTPGHSPLTDPKPKTEQSVFYPVQMGEILGSPGCRFRVLDFLGQGSFGQVVKAQKLDLPEAAEPEYYAIKIIRKSTPFLIQGRREVDLLNWIKQYGGVNAGNFIVQFVQDFMHANHLCLVFELLSTSLLDLVNLSIEANPILCSSIVAQPGLSLRMVHKFAHQLLTVLYILTKIKLIHCDIKPENISLTSPNMAHIKVLDFGSSCHASENVCNLYPYIQSRFYRSPEVLLGCKYSYPIDMWSLGCVLAELYTAKPLFAGQDRVEQLYVIMDTLGWPSRAILDSAVHSKFFFRRVDSKTVPRREYQWTLWKKHQVPLWERLNVKHEQPTDLEMFFDLVTRMLLYDPEQRITPEDALNHPFILRGPAARNRTHNEPPCAPHLQTIPSYVLPPYSFPVFGGLPLSKSQDPAIAHEKKQHKLRSDHFEPPKKRHPHPPPPVEHPKKQEMTEIAEEPKEEQQECEKLKPSRHRKQALSATPNHVSTQSPAPNATKSSPSDLSSSELLPSITVTLVPPPNESQNLDAINKAKQMVNTTSCS